MHASLRQYQGDHGAHVHDHAQVLFGVDGGLALDLQGKSAFVDAHCGLVIPAGIVHASRAAHGARVWVVDSTMRRGLERVRRFTLPAGWSPAVDGVDPEGWLAGLAQAPRQWPRRPLDVERLESALAGQLSSAWPTSRMAALFALSVPRFHARWLERTGLAPQAWLRQRRLDAAARQLSAGQSLARVADRVGYASASALAFALRRDRGLGARTLRRG